MGISVCEHLLDVPQGGGCQGGGRQGGRPGIAPAPAPGTFPGHHFVITPGENQHYPSVLYLAGKYLER